MKGVTARTDCKAVAMFSRMPTVTTSSLKLKTGSSGLDGILGLVYHLVNQGNLGYRRTDRDNFETLEVNTWCRAHTYNFPIV